MFKNVDAEFIDSWWWGNLVAITVIVTSLMISITFSFGWQVGLKLAEKVL